jgi:thioredoxin reductase (NADPH)
MVQMGCYDVCIIGSGPAAHTAAIYTSRACLKTVLFEGWMANDVAPGGQLTTTTDVENFPGFPGGIEGGELCNKFREQSSSFGTEIITETVLSIDNSERPFIVRTKERKISAKAVIIATGAKAKRLTFEGSEDFWNSGISACAVCDGAAPIFRNKPLAVVGGGDTAMEEATFLSKYASHVYIIHRRDTFNASKIMQQRVFDNPKIEVIWNSEVIKAKGDTLLRGITLKNNVTGAVFDMQVNGLFYAIGHEPASKFVAEQINTDKDGYILVESGSTKTNVPGIFAAGDVVDKVYKQAITAAGTGCMAAIDVINFLEEQK